MAGKTGPLPGFGMRPNVQAGNNFMLDPAPEFAFTVGEIRLLLIHPGKK
jgi:hypothetical protein